MTLRLVEPKLAVRSTPMGSRYLCHFLLTLSIVVLSSIPAPSHLYNTIKRCFKDATALFFPGAVTSRGPVTDIVSSETEPPRHARLPIDSISD